MVEISESLQPEPQREGNVEMAASVEQARQMIEQRRDSVKNRLARIDNQEGERKDNFERGKNNSYSFAWNSQRERDTFEKEHTLQEDLKWLDDLLTVLGSE